MNMVERVAHVLFCIYADQDPLVYRWAGVGKAVQEEWAKVARAAIEETSAPTEAMCWRGVRVAETTGAVLTMTQVHDIWQAMNDEALATEKAV